MPPVHSAISDNVTHCFVLHQVVFEKLLFVLFGIYLWELTIQMTFEWSFITGRRSFHWPLVSKSTILKHSQKQLILKLTGWVRWRPSMLCVLNLCWVFYFLCRYCMLFSFIGLWVKPGPLLRGAFWLSTTRIISLAVTTQVSARSSSLYANSWGVEDQLPCRYRMS